MSQLEDLIRMRHMLDQALEVILLIQGKNRADLNNSRLLPPKEL